MKDHIKCWGIPIVIKEKNHPEVFRAFGGKVTFTPTTEEPVAIFVQWGAEEFYWHPKEGEDSLECIYRELGEYMKRYYCPVIIDVNLAYGTKELRRDKYTVVEVI